MSNQQKPQDPQHKQSENMSISQADANKIYEILKDVVARMDRMEERHARDIQKIDQRFHEVRGEVAEVKGDLAEVKGEIAGMKHHLSTMRGYHWVLLVTLAFTVVVYIWQSDRQADQFRQDHIETQRMQVQANKDLREMQVQANKDLREMQIQSNKELQAMREKSDRDFKQAQQESKKEFRELLSGIKKQGGGGR